MSNAPAVPSRHFGSDNYAGVCPEVWETLRAADVDHVPGYGDDPYTQRAQALFQELFETDCEVHFVFNGTAANSLVVAAACEPFQAVICHAYSHVETDESNAPGFFAHGIKTLPIDTPLAKLDAAAVEKVFHNRRDIHASAPRVLSLTQSTELGTVYTPGQIEDLAQCVHRLGMVVHLDGARFANAVASLGCRPAEITWKAGVDALCFGGTKNGMMGSEAVVLFNPDLATNFKRRCKQSGQLASKMRYHSAQWLGMLSGSTWLKHATHANTMAAHLRALISLVPGVRVLYPTEANAVFVDFPPGMADKLLARGWRFYNDVGPGGARLMCAWNTTASDVELFVSDAKLAAEGIE
ncbi:MAG: low specificity L-threonine aldolase [Verrucomicrobiales bacterium]|nr:low specificity L-threonine aldolase [Verrucomicrobiales bacterium]